MTPTKFTWRWFALAFLAQAGLAGAVRPIVAAERAEILAAINSITKEEARQLIDTLADDSFEGREAGSRGGRAAGNLLMKEFEKLGLTPAGDGQTYFQSVGGSARNLLGLVEGSDPALKDQVIVVGAHYDHVGYGRSTNSYGPVGYIHNGADDNASGVSGIVEIIGAMKLLPVPPRRSVLFALWDAEEQGLLGSQHWLAAPTLKGKQAVAAVNLDMIGRLRNSRVEVYGTRTAGNFRRIVSQANAEAGLAVEFSWLMKADSDHWPFFTRSIPTLMFHTGLHGDYHRPSDDPHTVNEEGVAAVSRVVFLTVLDLANREAVGRFRAVSRSEHSGTRAWLEHPAEPQAPRFGIPFEVKGSPPQIVLLGVTRGLPAEKAGLKRGDRLLALQGQPIEDERRLRLELLAAAGETTFSVQRDGEPQPIEVKVTPIGSPIRVGIIWRIDEAEPDAVLVTHVVYGSAAHLVGLAVRDRIYSVNQQRFASEDEFTRLITTLPGPLEFEVERQGRISTLKLDVLDTM
jgi:hypothetical protein